MDYGIGTEELPLVTATNVAAARPEILTTMASMDGARARDGNAAEATAPTHEERSLETVATTTANQIEATFAEGFAGGAQHSRFALANQDPDPGSSYRRIFGSPLSSSHESVLGTVPSSYEQIFGGAPSSFQRFDWPVPNTDRSSAPDDGVDFADNNWYLFGPGIPAAEMGEDGNALRARNHENIMLARDNSNTTMTGDNGDIITVGDDDNTISARDDADAILAGSDEDNTLPQGNDDNPISAGDDDNIMSASFAGRIGLAYARERNALNAARVMRRKPSYEPIPGLDVAADAEVEEGEDSEDEFDLSSISVSKPIPIPNSPRTPRRRGRTYTAPRVVKSMSAPPFFPSEQDIDENIFFYMSMHR